MLAECHYMNIQSSLRAAFSHLVGGHRPPRARHCSTSAAGAGALGPSALVASAPLTVGLGSGFLLGAGVSTAVWSSTHGGSRDVAPSSSSSSSEMPFVQELQAKTSVVEVRTPGNQLRKHPIGKLLVDQDHLVRTITRSTSIIGSA